MPDSGFAGEAAVVTGAARGIGAATAARLRDEAAREVASVLAFLTVADASFVTGQVIAVDGGCLAARHPPREDA